MWPKIPTASNYINVDDLCDIDEAESFYFDSLEALKNQQRDIPPDFDKTFKKNFWDILA